MNSKGDVRMSRRSPSMSTHFLKEDPLMHQQVRTSPRPLGALVLALGLAQWIVGAAVAADAPASAPTTTSATAAGKSKPALTVNLIGAQRSDWQQTLSANGSVAAWQETVIGAETAGLRLAEVLVNVGDTVKRGQLLARLSSDTVQAELAQSRAAAAEARANLAAAQGDAERVRQLKASGSDALSAQQLQQYLTQELAAQARMEAANARLKTDELRLAQTRITAPDDGVISARLATLGAMAQPGAELFRLIRQNRLEWRAEVPAAELLNLRAGMAVQVQGLDGKPVAARLRMLSPTVDAQTRMGLAYVDLPAAAALRAGSFARGEFQLGKSDAVSLPQSAVQLRDGFAYVFRVGADARANQVKVSLGRRMGDRVEVTGGLDANARVVASGVGFLSDGDLVRVVEPAAASKPAAK